MAVEHAEIFKPVLDRMVLVGSHRQNNDLKNSVRACSPHLHILFEGNKDPLEFSQAVDTVIAKGKFGAQITQDTARHHIGNIRKLLAEMNAEERKQVMPNCSDNEIEEHFGLLNHAFLDKPAYKRKMEMAKKMEQRMSPKQDSNYLQWPAIQTLLIALLKKVTPDNVIDMQIVVGLAIVVFGSVMLRRDYAQIYIGKPG
ncbi:hypothetical protein HKX48_001662, partial [Thoreauomyces humboldtii]